MKVLIFGATGMIGQGVLRECMQDPRVTETKYVGRSTLDYQNEKIKQVIHTNFHNLREIENFLVGYDACFFCLGTPSSGKTEEEYSKITFDLTMSVANTLLKLNPHMTFIYVSGVGADPTEKGPMMWARVRGRLENALLKLRFKDVYIFRPGIVQPLDGIQSKTDLYRYFYSVLKPFLPLMKFALPSKVSSTREIGQAMINVVEKGYPQKILHTHDFKLISATSDV